MDDSCLSVLQVIIAQLGIQIGKGERIRKEDFRIRVDGKDVGLVECVCKQVAIFYLIGGVFFCCRNRRKVAETVIEQADRILELLRGFLHHDDADQLQSVFLGAGNEIGASVCGVAGLTADEIFISVGFAGQQLVFAVGNQILRQRCARRNLVACSIGHTAEHIICKEFLTDQGEVMGGGIVIIIMLAIGIDEVGICTAELLCGLVH